MKVVQVAPYYPPYPGGQERHVANLSRHLARRGHEVTVLTSNHPAGAADETRDGIRVVRVPLRGRVLRNPLVKGMDAHRRLLEEADVVHMHNEHAYTSWVASRMLAGGPVPQVLTCHGQLRFGNAALDAVERAYNATVGAGILKRMDRVVALSPTDEAYLQGLGVDPARTTVVPNALEPPARAPAEAVRAFRDKNGLGEAPLLLFVGPLLRRKAPQLLVKALPAVLARHPGAKAVFLGEGDALPECRRLVLRHGLGASVVFPGRVPRDDLYAAYQGAAAFVITSSSEGLPTTLLEALALGTPAVVSDLPAIADWFSDTTALVDPRTPALAEAVSAILADPEAARAKAKRGMDLVATRFSWDTVVQEVLATYAAARRTRRGA